ncbi:phosphoribosylaminoimidazolesuccinocarboxamide synthase [Winogradskyella maritima]|nr:phosphoribosylaminoimidazolesuccinocarboxamide synthase [Winogradskyella maritima]
MWCALPEGLKENDRFPSPIITPATKAEWETMTRIYPRGYYF